MIYSLITKLICLKNFVNLRDFYLINLWNSLLGGLGWSSRTVILSVNRVLCFPAAVPSTSVNPVSTNGLPIEIAGLHVLLNDEVFAKEIVPMVRPTQNRQYKVL